MFRNYLTVAVRNLVRHKAYSLINILGLAIGLAFCILTFLFVWNEWTYDTFHENASCLYRVLSKETMVHGGTPTTPEPLAPVLAAEIPGITHAVRFKTSYGGVVHCGDKAFNEQFLFADPGVFEMFSFRLVQGASETALDDVGSVVITEDIGRKYFGKESPLGKRLAIRWSGWPGSGGFEDFAVTGIAERTPENSSIQFDFLLPFERFAQTKGHRKEWGRYDTFTYVLLGSNAQVADVERQIQRSVTEHLDQEARQYYDRVGMRFALQPITDVHLDKSVKGGLTPPGDPAYGYVLSAISLCVLLVACINFINLSIGCSSTRFREIGMRKVLGASRAQVVRQLLGETLVLSLIALLVGVALAELVLPLFNSLTGRALGLHYSAVWGGLFGLVLFVGLVAGSYPALVVSAFRPVEVLTGKLEVGGTNWFSRGLIVVQFAVAILLTTSTFIMRKQLDLLRTRDLGFDGEQVVAISTTNLEWGERKRLMDAYRNELSGYNNIISVTATSHPFGQGVEQRYLRHQGDIIPIHSIGVDYDYLETLGIHLLEGRDFSEEYRTDAKEAVVVNEALVRRFGLDPPIGKRLAGFMNDPVIIGVVGDFHFLSLHHEIDPVVLYLGYSPTFLVRINPESTATIVGLLKHTWCEIAPHRPFEYSFLDDDVDLQYRAEERWSRIVRYACLLTILIACLGIFALTALAVARRTKEIGIRKALGASVPSILLLLCRELAGLVLLASIIAWPIAYFAMNKWLQNFAYRTQIQWSTFALAGAIALVIALATVSFQAVRAATANPVDALRYE